MDFSFAPAHDAWLAEVRAFVSARVAPRAAEIDRAAAYPRDLVVEAGRLGLLAATVPVALGGSGRDYLSYAVAVEAVALGSAASPRQQSRRPLPARRPSAPTPAAAPATAMSGTHQGRPSGATSVKDAAKVSGGLRVTRPRL